MAKGADYHLILLFSSQFIITSFPPIFPHPSLIKNDHLLFFKLIKIHIAWLPYTSCIKKIYCLTWKDVRKEALEFCIIVSHRHHTKTCGCGGVAPPTTVPGGHIARCSGGTSTNLISYPGCL